MTYDTHGDDHRRDDLGDEHRSFYGAVHEWRLYDRPARFGDYVPEPGEGSHAMHVVADPVYPRGHPRTPTAGELEHLADEVDSLVPDGAPVPGSDGTCVRVWVERGACGCAACEHRSASAAGRGACGCAACSEERGVV